MGRKGQVAQMSRSLLVKDKQRSHGRRKNVDNFVHTSDLQDGASYNRINFQSVTEQSNLEDFLTKAEMAGREFAAERQNFAIITDPGQGIQLTTDDVKKISSAQQQHKELLRIPRRPHWDEFTSKEQLLLLERDTFTEWRRQLNELELKEHIELTPYEKNLDFWRQLWRVIERSDVVVQIVDARNPLLFRCEDLEIYIRQLNQDKTPVLLVNKADYLNHQQRLQWVEYFNKQGIQAVFFSAKMEAQKHEDPTEDSPAQQSDDSDEEDDDEDTEDEDTEDELEQIAEEHDNDLNTDNIVSSSLTERLSPSHNATDSTGGIGSNQIPENVDCDNLDLKSLSIKNTSDTCDPDSSSCDNQKSSDNSTRVHFQSENVSTDKDTNSNHSGSGDNQSEVLLHENSPNIATADELLDILRKLSHPSVTARSGDVRTIGMVGYPNVGKSSTINVILKQKKLAVSVTPGRTKHLQTLYVDESLMLCDCPGLVFPSFVTTKAHLVINGILPIDELKDHVSPIGLVCEHIPRNVLEATYGMMIPRPSIDEDSNRLLRADELLNAYGGMRGFMTPRGIPDGPRASRYLLKDYVKGKLLFCNPPPGISAPEFQDETRLTELEAIRPVRIAPLPQLKSQVDKEFFQKRTSNVHSAGARGVKHYVRVDCLKQTSSMKDADGNSVDGGSMAGSSMSINSVGVNGKKPWKLNKNKKKEKNRRTNRDLDLH